MKVWVTRFDSSNFMTFEGAYADFESAQADLFSRLKNAKFKDIHVIRSYSQKENNTPYLVWYGFRAGYTETIETVYIYSKEVKKFKNS